MLLAPSPAFVISFVAFLGFTQAWYLDASCKTPKRDVDSCNDDSEYLPDMSTMVTQAVKNAFQLADAGKTALSTLKEQKGSRDQINLLEYMFAFAVNDGTVQQSTEFDRLYNVFNEIGGYNKEDGGNPSAQTDKLPTGDIIIFCDYSRMKENEDCFGNKKEGYACDTVTKRVVRISPMYEECKNGVVAEGDKSSPSDLLVSGQFFLD